MKIRILLSGGGTGGHVFPLIAVATALREKAANENIKLDLLVIGEGKFLKNACEENNLTFKPIVAGKVRRYFSFLNFVDVIKIPIGIIQCLWYMLVYMPNAVFAKGGYASFAPSFVAKLYFIPLFIHESDSAAGLTNRWVGGMARLVFIAFKNAEKEFKEGRTSLVGNPIRKELIGATKRDGMSVFNMSPEKKTTLFLGGSQGARTINNAVIQSLVVLSSKYQIIHQTGEGQYEIVKTEIEKIKKEGEGQYSSQISDNYRAFPFFSVTEMRAAYGAADIIVSRAGAANIFEIAAVGKPAIVVPLTHSASNHQMINAMEFSASGAILIKEENLTTHLLINEIEKLLKEDTYGHVATQIKSFAKVDAAEKVAEQLINLLK